MRIIAKSTLRDFWETYPDAETSLRYWFEQIGKQDWQSPNEVINAFNGADTVGNGRIVFNIGGNKYRLVAAFDYEFKVCWVKFIFGLDGIGSFGVFWVQPKT